jgi:hypothetical protein
MDRAAATLLSLSLCVALAASCRAPTEITLVVSTDVGCTDLRGTSITVGRLGEIETKAPPRAPRSATPREISARS